MLCYTSTVGLIEAVPNISEGRRSAVIEALGSALETCDGVTLLDTSSDATHNRTVFTLVGKPTPVKAALLTLFAASVERIDLRTHTGVHPRIGAVDVVPLVPLDPADMQICIALASELGALVARRFSVPVYLYEEAARRPQRQRLEQIRTGGFEGLTEKMLTREWKPDFGPATPHPSAGATVIGARRILIAFNINLNSSDIDIALRIASTIRESNGGLVAVKAIGVRTARDDVVQVSINLVNYELTPLHHIFGVVQREAQQLGATIRNSEIVGLAPTAALLAAATHSLSLKGFTRSHLLDTCMQQASSLAPSADPETLRFALPTLQTRK